MTPIPYYSYTSRPYLYLSMNSNFSLSFLNVKTGKTIKISPSTSYNRNYKTESYNNFNGEGSQIFMNGNDLAILQKEQVIYDVVQKFHGYNKTIKGVTHQLTLYTYPSVYG
jgi:hypothetical protein